MDFGVACLGSASLCSHTTKIKLVPLTLIAHTLAITVLWIPQVERTPTGSNIAGGSGKSVRSAQRTESAYLIFAVILPRRLQDVNGSFHCQWESLQSYQNSVSGIGMISMRFAQCQQNPRREGAVANRTRIVSPQTKVGRQASAIARLGGIRATPSTVFL